MMQPAPRHPPSSEENEESSENDEGQSGSASSDSDEEDEIQVGYNLKLSNLNVYYTLRTTIYLLYKLNIHIRF